MKNNHQSKSSLLQRGKVGFDGLKKREQNLLFVLVPFTIMVVFFLLLLEPEINNSERLAKSVSTLENQLFMGRQNNTELLSQATIDPNATLRQQVESLQKKLTQLNAEFESELNQLVSPQAMSVLLEQLFAQATNLSLLNMTSMEPQILNAKGQNQRGLGEQHSLIQQPIFRHGIEITFEGGFFATRDFLFEAEALGWRMYWQDLSYVVGEHPNAVTKMTLFTLSTSEAFIGVN
jgi:MSHA biogenesis protein MshJ